MKTTFTTVFFCLLLSQIWAQQLDSTSTYWWSGNAYDRSNTFRYEYDANGRVSGYKSYAFDGLLNWREVSRSEYFYSSQGLLQRLVTMNVDAQGNLDSGQTINWQYNSNNLIAVEIRVNWFGANRVVTQTTNQYTANGLLDSSWTENMQNGAMVLQNTYKYHYSGTNLVRYDLYTSNTAGLVRTFRFDYVFDPLNRLQEENQRNWNTQTSTFELNTAMDYFYTGSRLYADSLKGETPQAFPGSPSIFKRVFEYDSNDSLLLSETFDGTTGNWVPLWKQTFAYRAIGAGMGVMEPLIFKAFPNPATDQLHIQITESQLLHLDIRSLTGQSIKQLVLSPDQNSIDLQDLPSGMYLLHLHAGGKSAIHKLVKQ